jgi:hypothetical protein
MAPWRELRTRRVVALASFVAGIAARVVLGANWGWVACGAIVVAALARLLAWRCPRCRGHYAPRGMDLMPLSCASCGLEGFTDPASSAVTAEHAAFEGNVPARRRKFIAGAQVAAGMLAASDLVASVLTGMGMPTLTFIATEGMAGAGIVAGVALWRGEPRGYTWTRRLLALQVVALSCPLFTYKVALGPMIRFTMGVSNWKFEGGFDVQAYVGGGADTVVSINLLALWWLVLLTRVRGSAPVQTPAAG